MLKIEALIVFLVYFFVFLVVLFFTTKDTRNYTKVTMVA